MNIMLSRSTKLRNIYEPLGKKIFTLPRRRLCLSKYFELELYSCTATYRRLNTPSGSDLFQRLNHASTVQPHGYLVALAHLSDTSSLNVSVAAHLGVEDLSTSRNNFPDLRLQEQEEITYATLPAYSMCQGVANRSSRTMLVSLHTPTLSMVLLCLCDFLTGF